MKFKDYENFCGKVDKYLAHDYYFLGLASEAGEVCDVRKRIHRGDYTLSAQWKPKLKDELGDVIWYATMIAVKYGWTLEEVLERNMEKLKERYDL